MVAPLGSLTEEHIDYHLGVNVKGVIEPLRNIS
jgi:hypothetical protein